jgi:hypothetical protein
MCSARVNGGVAMMTMANSLYANLKKRGSHNLDFPNIQQTNFEVDDLEDESIDPDWHLKELEH